MDNDQTAIADDTGARILMCAPDHFTVSYTINPWMDPAQWAEQAGTLTDAARREWRGLHRRLKKLGATIELVPPVADSPDLVFTANAAVIMDGIALVARFRHPERQDEEAHFERSFRELWARGIIAAVRTMPDGIWLEGAGDCVWDQARQIFWMGYGPRSQYEAAAVVQDTFGIETIPLELVNPRFYHMDTAISPLPRGELMYVPSAFSEAGLHQIYDRVAPEQRIPLSPEDAAVFAANSVHLGDNIVMSSCSAALRRRLQEAGYRVHSTSLAAYPPQRRLRFLPHFETRPALSPRQRGAQASAQRRLAGLEPDQRGLAVNRNLGTETQRQAAHAIENRRGDFSACQHRATASGPAQPMAQIERMETKRRKPLCLELADSSDPLPIFRRCRKAARLVAGARIEKIGRRRFVVETEATIGFRGKDRDIIVLENEIAEAVEDRPALIDFDAQSQVRPVTGNNIGTRLDRRMRKIDGKPRRLFEADIRRGGQRSSRTEFMIVQREDHPIRLAPRLSDPAQIGFGIRRLDLGRDGEAGAALEAMAEEIDRIGAVFGRLLRAEEHRTLARALLRLAELFADMRQRGERGVIDGKAG